MVLERIKGQAIPIRSWLTSNRSTTNNVLHLHLHLHDPAICRTTQPILKNPELCSCKTQTHKTSRKYKID
jgi:hypothetical protein